MACANMACVEVRATCRFTEIFSNRSSQSCPQRNEEETNTSASVWTPTTGQPYPDGRTSVSFDVTQPNAESLKTVSNQTFRKTDAIQNRSRRQTNVCSPAGRTHKTLRRSRRTSSLASEHKAAGGRRLRRKIKMKSKQHKFKNAHLREGQLWWCLTLSLPQNNSRREDNL